MFESLHVYTFICYVEIMTIKITKMCNLPNASYKSSLLTHEVKYSFQLHLKGKQAKKGVVTFSWQRDAKYPADLKTPSFNH